jgi:hypothetical protein
MNNLKADWQFRLKKRQMNKILEKDEKEESIQMIRNNSLKDIEREKGYQDNIRKLAKDCV